jgi:cysteine desulfurase
MIYLDNASTTKPRKEVLNIMKPYFDLFWYNPSSLYAPSVTIKKQIEKARETVGNFIGANGNEIYFTSGGSESNCWAIQGFVNECWSKGRHPIIITSTIEHKSILDCVENAQSGIDFINVDNKGFVNIDSLKKILSKLLAARKSEILDSDVLVSIQYANNEIGTIQNIKDIATIAHEYGALFHTDAVQAFGQIPINVKELGVDMLSASGHKIGTPKGIGFLYKKSNVNIKPLIYGSQMDGMRGGTENVPYIIGMAKAVELISREHRLEDELKMSINKNYFINRLKSMGCMLNGSLECRLNNNINITLPQNVTGESLVYALDTSQIYVATGSACNSHSIEPSHVLKAIGLTDEESMRTLRLTLSIDINEGDIDKVIEELEKAIKIIEGGDEYV